MRGELSRKCDIWRQRLVRAMALMEAVIDFADEDVPTDVRPEVSALLNEVLGELTREIDGRKAAERIRDGFEVALVGKPNVGKSTLLNAIAGRDVAITSEIAGTTRDVIEVRLDLDGLPVTLLDLAGIRESTDSIEKLGVDLALSRAVAADMRVFLVERADEASGFGIDVGRDDIIALAKADISDQRGLRVSGKTGYGIEALLAEIGGNISGKVFGSSLLIRQRHMEAIILAKENLVAALDGLESEAAMDELIAADLRFSVSALDGLVGRIDVEQVLGEIFAGFCIGK